MSDHDGRDPREGPPELGAPGGGLLPEGGLQERDVFLHPQWTVGVVMIMAAVMIFLGVFGHPVWFLIGSPFILAFLVWLGVRVTGWLRPRPGQPDEEA